MPPKKAVSTTRKPAAQTKKRAAAKNSADASAAKQLKTKGKVAVKKSESDDENVEIKTVKIRGKAAVDEESAYVETHHVYYEGEEVWHAMLNQTNVQNNNNKYYLLQLLQSNNQKSYTTWFRWGRVGKKGQCSAMSCSNDLEKAKKLFCAKFLEKTRNSWDAREKFEKVNGKYDLLQMDYSTEDVNKSKDDEVDGKKAVEKKPKKEVKSELDPRLQDLIELIFNIQLMEDTVTEMKYNAKKAPLGKLTVSQIKSGYTALKAIEDLIQKNKTGTALIEACNEFYTRIPHDFGMKRPPLIRTVMDIKSKMELLTTLGDVQIAMTILNETEKTKLEHPIDQHFHSLKCLMKPLEKEGEEYQMVEQYLQNTHAKTHSHYNLNLKNVFESERSGEKEKFKDVGNRLLLWHGSRLTNSVGIISQGLRVAPKEAPCTGYMFGKGVYFADMSSKSANYCYATRNQNKGLMFLCEVAVGKPRKLLAADSEAHKLPKGYNSVMGQGSVAPNPEENLVLANGVVVPKGKGIETGIENPSGYTLNYNEYIVYDVDQIKLKYILQIEFKFK